MAKNPIKTIKKAMGSEEEEEKEEQDGELEEEMKEKINELNKGNRGRGRPRKQISPKQEEEDEEESTEKEAEKQTQKEKAQDKPTEENQEKEKLEKDIMDIAVKFAVLPVHSFWILPRDDGISQSTLLIPQDITGKPMAVLQLDNTAVAILTRATKVDDK